MSRSFHDLPAELVESVLKDLSLDDKRALRQTSTQIADRINESSFRENFRRKHLHLTKKALEVFIELSKTSKLVCLLQDLVLVGIVWFKTTPPTTDGDLVRRGALLGEGLNNVRMNSQLQSLHSLSLQVITRVGSKILTTDEALFGSLSKPCKPRPARPVWKVISETFSTATIALTKSQMPIQELDLFTQAQRCGLPYDAFDSATQLDLSVSLRDVKKLSMRVSDPFPSPLRSSSRPPYNDTAVEAGNTQTSWKGKGPMYRQAVSVSTAPAFDRMIIRDREVQSNFETWLKRFMNLESLHIQRFNLAAYSSMHQENSRELFGQTIGTVLWPKLATLSLGNVSISVDTVQQCLNKYGQLRDVTLRNIRLIDSGTHADLVEWLQDTDNPPEHLLIDNLWAVDPETPLILHYIKDETTQADLTSLPKISLRIHDRDGEWERQQYGPPWRLD